MKRFKDFLRETSEVLGYASLRNQKKVDAETVPTKAPEPDVITAYASLRNHPQVDRELDPKTLKKESFTRQHTIPRDEFSKNFHKYSDKKGHVGYGSDLSRLDRAGMEEKEAKANYAAVAHHKTIPFDGEDHEHVEMYSMDSSELNRHLIQMHKKKKPPTRFKKDVAALDAVLTHKKNALKRKMVSYSGVGDKVGAALSEAKIGSHVHFPAYTSTSIDHDIASNFARSTPTAKAKVPKHTSGGSLFRDTHVGHTVVFHFPKGYNKGRHIEHISVHRGENEFLLARGQKFRLKERRYDPHLKMMYHHLEPVG